MVILLWGASVDAVGSNRPGSLHEERTFAWRDQVWSHARGSGLPGNSARDASLCEERLWLACS